MRIDSHQHFWRIDDRQGHWPPSSLGAIHRDFEPRDLRPLLAQCAVDGTVLVQSLPSAADTSYLLQLASGHDFVRGVVGWVDMTSPEAPDRIAEHARHPRLKGLRPMLQDLADDDWSTDPAYDAAARAMCEHGLAFDALVLARQLPALRAFAQRHPGLSIVVDHGAKPWISQAIKEPWGSHLASIAELPNVHCKLSGLMTEAGARSSIEELSPYVGKILSCFGWRRVMWGSDWPVLCLAGEYHSWLAMAQSLCRSQGDVDADAMAAIFGGNARSFYRLD